MLKIIELCNGKKLTKENMDEPAVSFFRDWGGMSLTVCTAETHAHVGSDYKSSFEDLIDELYRFLNEQASKQS